MRQSEGQKREIKGTGRKGGNEKRRKGDKRE